MGWFSNIFAARQQAEFYKARLAQVQSAKDASDKALLDEIRRNRLREDKLNSKILELSGSPVTLPGRAEKRDALSGEPVQGVLDLEAADAAAERDSQRLAFERDVRHRAQEFIRIAEQSGNPYTAEQIDELYKRIADDPDQFLN